MSSVAEQRRSRIMDELARQRLVKIGDLSAQFGVSGVSIRRDLERLERLGLLKRVLGLTTIMPLERMHKLIIDENAPASFVNAAREAGVEVILV